MQEADYFLELQTKTGWGRTLSRFAAWVAPKKNGYVLDIGCGPGLLPALFKDSVNFVCGVDLDPQMFQPARLHRDLAVADTNFLPFAAHSFDLVTASNLLFLLLDPQPALQAMRRVLQPQGQLAMLNPSENLNVNAAASFADSRNLHGFARDSLLHWAARAEANHRWSQAALEVMFELAGMRLIETTTTVGPGFARCARAILE